jgi:diguanylate cyclase (GGDEF)-like protein/PAS domain S-box-containing protein
MEKMSRSRFSKNIHVIPALTAVYFAAGKLGLMLAFVNSSATAVWPCTGIALAAFLMLGYDVWPSILLGAFFVNVTNSGSAGASLGISIGNTAEGLLGAYLVNRFANGRNFFDRSQDIFKFTALAGMISTAVSATLGSTSLSLGGLSDWSNYPSVWLTWWVGDAVGSLIVTPPLVLWRTTSRFTWKRDRIIEAAVLLFSLLLVSQIVFGGLFPFYSKNYPLAYLCIPILIWAAFRFDKREVSAAVFILSGIAIWGTLRGFGPFVRESPNESLLLLQTYIGVLAVTVLSLAAVVSEQKRIEQDLRNTREELEQGVLSRTEDLSRANKTLKAEIAERKRTEKFLRTNEAKFRKLLESAPDPIVIVNRKGRIVLINAQLERSSGYTRDELVEKPLEVLLPDRFKEVHVGHRSNYFTDPRTRPMGNGLALSVRRKDGSEFPVDISLSPFETEEGTLAMAVIRDITERKQAEERLSYLANHDVLTDLPNRNLFFDRLEQALPRVRWHNRLVAVLFLDLDNFKQINDTLGHHMGDLLLKAVGKRLSAFVRTGDTVARLGGDEFVLVLVDIAKAEDVPQIAHKILDGLSKAFDLEGVEIFITVSIGITLNPNDGEDPETLLKNADAAMYRAKEHGRNNYQFYSSSMNIKVLERLSLETDLHHAMERSEFLLYYQPQVDLRSGQIVGMEALIRWNKSGSGMISPAKFIPVAEETGLILPIGEWVLRVACAQCKAWQEAGLLSTFIAVNLSARQFQQQNMVETVTRILKETVLDPNYLELELTESILMKREDITIKTLQELNAMGIRLSIDDFGTGYSSLSYLKRFPIGKLKIDQSFVRDLVSDPDNAAIVSAIVTLGHSLKLKVIAEAVETVEELKFLRSLECDEIQGYFFSRPLPSEEATKLLMEGKRL